MNQRDTELMQDRARGLRASGIGRYTDRLFAGLLLASGLSVLAILGLMVGQTTFDAIPVFRYESIGGFVFGQEWRAGFAFDQFTGRYGAFPFIYGTLFVSFIAVVIALPLALAVSLFITQIAPFRLRTALSYAVEVLAAIPSIVFGLWGLLWLIPTLLLPFSTFVSRTLGQYIPYLSGPVPNVNYFHAGVVLACMILPIITAITREIISTCPQSEQQAAYALGATRWEVIRSVILPRSFAGIVGATMLGLGRALGETIAVLMTVGGSQHYDVTRLFFGGDTLAAHIAATFQDASRETLSALFGIGVVIFAVTVIVNMAARLIVLRFGRISGDAV